MRKILAAAACVVGLTMTACTNEVPAGKTTPSGGADQSASAPAGSDDKADGKYTFAMVTHSSAGDAFWDIVKSGGEDAAAKMGVTMTYQADPDPAQQSILITNAIAQGVDGIIVSMANPDGLKEAIGKAVEAKIPVITINSGIERYKEFGAMTHVGQSEELAGETAGEQFKAAGKSKMICVIHEAGNIGQEQRCAGAAKTFGGSAENLQVDIADLAAVQNTVTAKLQADPSIDAVFTLNGSVTTAALKAIEGAGSEAMLGGIDLDADVVTAIKDGKVSFAVDQQPYAQGWLPIVFLTQKVSDAMDTGGGQPVYSGPLVVTKDNVEQIADAISRGKH
ncbi:sugar ABC transporter substrate-binding protein [Bowdeniella nasicola]|nr:sugar ABC transporter substrate-binding protein [Bowdeniella nasicola]